MKMKILPVLPLGPVLHFNNDLWPSRGIVNNKNTTYIKCYLCIQTYLYILAEISAHHLQLKYMCGHCFLDQSYIAIVSDIIKIFY